MPRSPYHPRLGPPGDGYQGMSVVLKSCWKCTRYRIDPEDEFGLCDDCKVVLRDPEYADRSHFPKPPDTDRTLED